MRSPGTPHVSSPILLVVEDEPYLIRLLRLYLHREGYRVRTATDGQEALEIVDQSWPADLVLLDLMLPSLDGFQLARHIRSKPDWRRTPILVLTARSDERDIVRAYQSGADDLMTKPFHPRELSARIRQLLKSEPGYANPPEEGWPSLRDRPQGEGRRALRLAVEEGVL
jgi:DNA-binding response OmpR family regulator